MSVSAFGSVAPRDPRRPERGRTMERRHGFRVLRPSWRDGQQPPGRPRDQHARAAPDSELHGLHQHVDDSETTGAAALAREADPADLGTRESVWPIRSRHEYAIGVAVIEMAPGDTTVGSTPARKSRGVVHLIGWAAYGTRFSARSLLCPRLDSGDPPDALEALSRTIRQHPGRSSRPLADRLRLDGLPSPSLSHPQEGLRRATPWRARLPRCTGNQAGGPALSHQ